MSAIFDWLEDAWGWLTRGPLDSVILAHHPDDGDAREALGWVRSELPGRPVRIVAADELELDDRLICLGRGRFLVVWLYRPGLRRLFGAAPIRTTAFLLKQ